LVLKSQLPGANVSVTDLYTHCSTGLWLVNIIHYIVLTQFETVHQASLWIASSQRDVSSGLDEKRKSGPRAYRRRHQPVGDQCPAGQPETAMCDLHGSHALLHRKKIIVNNIRLFLNTLKISISYEEDRGMGCCWATKILLYQRSEFPSCRHGMLVGNIHQASTLRLWDKTI